MQNTPALRKLSIATGLIVALLILGGCKAPPVTTSGAQASVVRYEAFGAVGDGETDDLPAIVAAHAYANENGLSVRSKPDAVYHLGTRALTAIIETDTDWNTSRFIIDDSAGVEDFRKPLFHVRSALQPIPLEIDRLAKGQEKLEQKPATACLVRVENANRKVYIRRGLNPTPGENQKEAFILHEDGTIEGAIEWEYETVTEVTAMPIDPEPLVLRGGVFTHYANAMRQEEGSQGSRYWIRNIQITRSNTIVDGVTNRVAGEGEFGQPYAGFLRAKDCANITFRNCRIDGRKTYTQIGRAGKPVPSGTYGYQADTVVNFQMLNCSMNTVDIHDTSRWGVVASNFIKNFLVENCELSRVDVHMGVSGHYTIRSSTIGHAGINAIGKGLLLIEDSSVFSSRLVAFRSDYGSTWEGEVLVRNSRWVVQEEGNNAPVMFRLNNDGTHDFGYPCFMPETIRIDGLVVDDALLKEGPDELAFFNDVLGPPLPERPFPLRLTQTLEVQNLTTASGRPMRISDNPELVEAIQVIGLE